MNAKAPSSVDEDKSKDLFFEKLGALSEEMIAAHGKEFAMGSLILAARFIAEGKPLMRPEAKEAKH